jgi:hypothetical protein
MAMGKRKRHAKQTSMWVAMQDLPCSAAHPFYRRLNRVLDEARISMTPAGCDAWRQLVGIGTPRSLQDRGVGLLGCLWSLIQGPEGLWDAIRSLYQPFTSPPPLLAPRKECRIHFTVTTTCATGR